MDGVISAYNLGRDDGSHHGSLRRVWAITTVASCLARAKTLAQEAYYRGFIAGWWESFP